jgi:hypothetical protein
MIRPVSEFQKVSQYLGWRQQNFLNSEILAPILADHLMISESPKQQTFESPLYPLFLVFRNRFK